LGNEKVFQVKLRIYPLESVMATAFVFIDECYVFLDKSEKDSIDVRLRGKPDTTADAFKRVVGEFENELLNQALRLKVSKRTEKIRDAIVHRALYSSMSQSVDLGLDDDDDVDFLDDPLGIAVPWEEKYSKEDDKEGKETE